MKSLFRLILFVSILCSLFSISLAEPRTIDLSTMTLEELQQLQDEISAAISTLSPSDSTTQYVTLTVGYNGPEVAALKQRMYDLGYFQTNTVNEKYTETTANYVREFQKDHGLPVTGIADAEMQALFFSDDAKPKPTPTPDPRKAYSGNFNYKDVARYPETYKGQKYKITGYVAQVLGTRKDGYQIRLATKGKYDNIIYLLVFDDPGFGILEDDRITVYGSIIDPITYTTVRGDEITIPGFMTDSVELK